MRKWKYIVVFNLFLLISGWVVHQSHVNDLPKGMHSWAQADRYAITYNYVNENRSFNDPATQSLLSEEGNTGVELPLLQYIAASLSGGSTTYLPLLNRATNAFVLWIGLNALFLVVFKPEQGFKNLLGFIAALSSPTVLFYSYSFLADTPSLGLTLLGIAIAIHYKRTNGIKWLCLSLVVLALSTAIKASAGIYFCTIAFIGIVHLIKIKSYKKGFLTGLLSLALLSLVVYYDLVHVAMKNKEIWAVIFMSAPNPIESFTAFFQSFKHAYSWLPQVFWIPGLIALMAIIGCAILNKRKALLIQTLAFVFGLGCLCFWILFGVQFGHHDYYWIASFYPAFIIGVIYGFQYLFEVMQRIKQPVEKVVTVVLSIGVIILFGFATTKAKETYNDLYAYKGNIITNETTWMEDGSDVLLEAGIDKADPILVMYDFAPNLSLVYFQRKGMVFNFEQMTRPYEKHIHYWMNRIQPKAIIVRNKWIGHFKKDQPLFYKSLKITTQHQEFTILKPTPKSFDIKKGDQY